MVSRRAKGARNARRALRTVDRFTTQKNIRAKAKTAKRHPRESAKNPCGDEAPVPKVFHTGRPGRPRIKLDENQVRRLAAIGRTNEEIAYALGVCADTLERNFAGALKEGGIQRHISIRHKRYQLAMQGHPGMLIWLGKVDLKQKAPARELDVNEQRSGHVTLDPRAVQAAEEFLGRSLEIGEAGRAAGDDEVVAE